jgi:endonuclease YncB( thermonuclease family)
MIPTQQWVFPAQCARVVDGDTLDLMIDTGLHSRRLERGRLLGVNAPELHGPTQAAGLAATLWVTDWLEHATGAWPLLVRTIKDPDHFGRYLVDVWRLEDGANLGEALLASGHAVVFRPS